MAVEALGHAPRPPGVLTRLGASLLDGLQILGEATRLFFATVRAAAFVPADRQRVVVQMVRVGTDPLFIGVWGGAAVVVADPAITLPVSTYFARMLEWVHFTDFVVGLVKGVVFGMVASILPCTFGLRTRGGTEGIAASTTAAVVWSFILILVFDFLIVRVTFALD